MTSNFFAFLLVAKSARVLLYLTQALCLYLTIRDREPWFPDTLMWVVTCIERDENKVKEFENKKLKIFGSARDLIKRERRKLSN